MSEEQTYRFEVPEGIRKKRIDKILTDAFDQFSRSDLHRAFEEELVTCGGRVVPKNHRVSVGDELSFSMPIVRKLEMAPVEMPLDIVYEDAHIVVVNKAPGVTVHPGAGMDEPTLAHGLLHHCKGELSGIGGVERPGIVHRLDRETSGLIVVAKTDGAHKGLSERFQSRDVVKEYQALVMKVPHLQSGSIKKPIGRDTVHRHKMKVVEGERGREAHTDWKLERSFGSLYALVRCRIHTGRTHQIRVHMKSVGHPILGDVAYGYRKLTELPHDPPRVMLHSELLRIGHPETGELMEFRAALPIDFQSFLK